MLVGLDDEHKEDGELVRTDLLLTLFSFDKIQRSEGALMLPYHLRTTRVDGRIEPGQNNSHYSDF